MKDKVKIKETISFVKNGVPIEHVESPDQEIGKGEWKPQSDINNDQSKPAISPVYK